MAGGCIAITQPLFFAPDDWIAVPSDWSQKIVSGRGYDLTEGEGLRLWTARRLDDAPAPTLSSRR